MWCQQTIWKHWASAGLFFPGLKTRTCVEPCRPSAVPEPAHARQEWAGEEPAVIQPWAFVWVTHFWLSTTLSGGMCSWCCHCSSCFLCSGWVRNLFCAELARPLPYRFHTKSISRLFPCAAPRNEGRLSLRTVLTLPGFSFQWVTIFCLGCLSLISPKIILTIYLG